MSNANIEFENIKMVAGSSNSKITIVGVGGAGCNMINSMIGTFADFTHIESVAINTDVSALDRCRATTRLRIGEKLALDGLSGILSKKDSDAIKAILTDVSYVIIVAGMGGGTGTYVAPIVAEIANEINASHGTKEIRIAAFVTRPFTFEGTSRQRCAQIGIDELKKHTADVHVISNDQILKMSNNGMSMLDAFKVVDEKVCQMIKDYEKTLGSVPKIV